VERAYTFGSLIEFSITFNVWSQVVHKVRRIYKPNKGNARMATIAFSWILWILHKENTSFLQDEFTGKKGRQDMTCGTYGLPRHVASPWVHRGPQLGPWAPPIGLQSWLTLSFWITLEVFSSIYLNSLITNHIPLISMLRLWLCSRKQYSSNI
jgi:hypothetical protein